MRAEEGGGDHNEVVHFTIFFRGITAWSILNLYYTQVSAVRVTVQSVSEAQKYFLRRSALTVTIISGTELKKCSLENASLLKVLKGWIFHLSMSSMFRHQAKRSHSIARHKTLTGVFSEEVTSIDPAMHLHWRLERSGKWQYLYGGDFNVRKKG